MIRRCGGGRWGLLGAYGAELHARCWGRDERPVTVDSPRKSLSIENTFTENIRALPELEREMRLMLDELEEKRQAAEADRRVRSLVVKLKFADFRRTTAERAHAEIDREIFRELLAEAESRSQGEATRLLGVCVRFHDVSGVEQMELF